MQETLAPSKELVNNRKVLYGHTFNHEIGYLLCLHPLYEVAGSLCCLVLFSAGRAQTRVSQERVASRISVPASILFHWRPSDVFSIFFSIPCELSCSNFFVSELICFMQIKKNKNKIWIRMALSEDFIHCACGRF